MFGVFKYMGVREMRRYKSDVAGRCIALEYTSERKDNIQDKDDRKMFGVFKYMRLREKRRYKGEMTERCVEC